MSRGPYRFRASEMRRAIKAARLAGIEISRIEVKDGVIAVVPGRSSELSRDVANPWDEVFDAPEQKRSS